MIALSCFLEHTNIIQHSWTHQRKCFPALFGPIIGAGKVYDPNFANGFVAPASTHIALTPPVSNVNAPANGCALVHLWLWITTVCRHTKHNKYCFRITSIYCQKWSSVIMFTGSIGVDVEAPFTVKGQYDWIAKVFWIKSEKGCEFDPQRAFHP